MSQQEYMRILLELNLLTNKFVSLVQDNQKLLDDFQQVSVKKTQEVEKLSAQVQQVEAIVLSLQHQGPTS